jgi:large subunit ribosomal protein L21
MRYAVVVAGGKQHRVREGDLVRVEKIDADVGASITLDRVLLIGGEGDPKIGRPLVAGATVSAQVVEHERAKKVVVFHRKRRVNHRRLKGHRQPYTRVKITGIQG